MPGCNWPPRRWPTVPLLAIAMTGHAAAIAQTLDYRIERTAATSGYDHKTCWVHARAGAIPAKLVGEGANAPLVIMTLQRLLLSRSDVFYGLNTLETADLGKTWTGPAAQPALDRRSPREGVEVVPCDFWPKWHRQTGKLLGTGATFWYDATRDDHLPGGASETTYAVYDPAGRSWGSWKTLTMPEEPKFEFDRAGCTQRYDLPNGDILLPVYFYASSAESVGEFWLR